MTDAAAHLSLDERARCLRLEQPGTWDALERFVARLVGAGVDEEAAIRRALEALGR